MKITELYDLSHTAAGDYLAGFTYPWQALEGLKDFILALGPTLPKEEYDQREPNVWVHKTAKVFPSAYLGAPCIIGPDTEVRHCAFIRGSALVGAGCVVGNSVELKNVILFDGVQTPHYNYVGDSILGYKSHMGAGSITSNVKSDKTLVVIHDQAPRGDRAEESGGVFGRPRGGGLQQRAQPRHGHWPQQQRLSRLLCPGRYPGQQHLQVRRSRCAQEVSRSVPASAGADFFTFLFAFRGHGNRILWGTGVYFGQAQGSMERGYTYDSQDHSH